ncbi:VOC family protein [Ancylobacter amanitiformis]|uniref:Catechol 2,3-dioxygenase n=1 Tax=Ancylobacter amanitiformis TaxID=217069 RepID=A0ABU0LNY0_9HYPH|nr:VOC family protein [Ancylobacter amanitiformis]MDQ0510374.1 catechol 2,3-dioxygenase [Ancylobacter amanitiformis]
MTVAPPTDSTPPTDSAPASLASGLPAGLAMGAVRLRVRDAARASTFYTGTLGLTAMAGDSDGIVRLGAGGRVLIELEERRDARPRPPGTTGLFHVAILVPDRAALAVALRRLVARRIAIGASDHIVSEALYLDDPDGNGIEIYRDRPAGDWRWENGTVAMATDHLDGRGLLNEAPAAIPLDAKLPAGTRIGHVHLQVGDLARARRFYVEHVGFEVTTDRYPGALFVSAGGYHHHLGLNIWQSRGGGPAPQDSVGLVHYAVELPDAAAVEALRVRLEAAGESTAPIPGGFSAADPWGTRVWVTAG